MRRLLPTGYILKKTSGGDSQYIYGQGSQTQFYRWPIATVESDPQDEEIFDFSVPDATAVSINSIFVGEQYNLNNGEIFLTTKAAGDQYEIWYSNDYGVSFTNVITPI